MRYWYLLTLAVIMIACQSAAQKTKAQIEALQALEMKIMEAQDVNMDTSLAREFLAKAKAFATDFPEDTLSASYLLKAAGVAQGLREYGQAIQLAGRVWREYPDQENAPAALFLQGFIYDSDLNDTTNARKYYEQFLTKYPNHPFAENANQLLSVLGKDPEALIREFEKNKE